MRFTGVTGLKKVIVVTTNLVIVREESLPPNEWRLDMIEKSIQALTVKSDLLTLKHNVELVGRQSN